VISSTISQIKTANVLLGQKFVQFVIMIITHVFKQLIVITVPPSLAPSLPQVFFFKSQSYSQHLSQFQHYVKKAVPSQ